jgi:hypothetical protein
VQIENFRRDHGGARPLYLETSAEVFQELRSYLRARGKWNCLHEAYVMLDGVEVFPVS